MPSPLLGTEVIVDQLQKIAKKVRKLSREWDKASIVGGDLTDIPGQQMENKPLGVEPSLLRPYATSPRAPHLGGILNSCKWILNLDVWTQSLPTNKLEEMASFETLICGPFGLINPTKAELRRQLAEKIPPLHAPIHFLNEQFPRGVVFQSLAETTSKIFRVFQN